MRNYTIADRTLLQIERLLPGGSMELRERHRALQRQVPLLYVIVLANVFGLQSVTGDVFSTLYPANILILLVIVRLLHWATSRDLDLSESRLRAEFQRTLMLTALLSSLFGLWAILIFNETSAVHQNSVTLFVSLGAVGCAYGLSSFPAAARLPLLLAAIPFSIRLTLSSGPAHIAMGISLALVTLLILRLINVQNAGITELVRSRTLNEQEQQRAQAAEKAALEEREKAERLANTDVLTKLSNRRAFMAALAEPASRRRAVALVDLDGFKPINDTFGHATGDEVLVEVAQRLKEAAGAGAVVSRLGGDEFALLLDCSEGPAALGRAEAICWTLHRPLLLRSRQFQISASCGVAMIDVDGYDASMALRQADTALYRSKQLGRGTAALYSAEMDAAANRRQAIEALLKDDTVQNTITLLYQPIMDLESGGLRGFEALARWTDPGIGVVGPSEFIPIAEQTNVIEALSSKLLHKAASEAREWPDTIMLSFNLSAAELCGYGAARRILHILSSERFDPRRLQIEVTETTMLTDFGTAGRELDQLRAAGVHVVLDDFGAGYASVSYLREMRFDGVKLDGDLLKFACENPLKLRLLKGILQLCKSLDLPCIAEQLETAEQLRLLQENGCSSGQGRLLSHPLPAAQARQFARAQVPSTLAQAGGQRPVQLTAA